MDYHIQRERLPLQPVPRLFSPRQRIGHYGGGNRSPIAFSGARRSWQGSTGDGGAIAAILRKAAERQQDLAEKKIADAHDLIKALSEENTCVLDFPTAYWTYFSQQLYQDKLQLPKCVKKIIIGGEKANKSSLTKWNNSQSKIELYNSYGPTETTVIASVWGSHLEKNDVIINEIPIGKAIYGYSLYVLDQSYNHLPIAVNG